MMTTVINSKKIRRRLYCLAWLALPWVFLYPLYTHSGWPNTHESAYFMQRTAIYAELLSHGELVPVWSTTDFYGQGSPLPILYHKLYYYVSGGIQLVVHDPKCTALLSLALFFYCAALGLTRLFMQMGAGKGMILLGMAAFFSSSYFVLDWLVRGAMAETSAFCLLPWVYLHIHHLFTGNTFKWWLGPLMAALFLAHSLVALMAGILCAGALLYYVIVQRKWVWFKGLTMAVGSFVICVLPWVFPMFYFKHYVDMSIVLGDQYSPFYQSLGLGRYFYDSTWKWGNTMNGITPQLDVIYWVFPVAGIAMALVRKKREILWMNPMLIGYMLFSFGLVTYMQTPAAFWVYRLLPPLQYIQFPWRFLVLASMSSTVLLVSGYLVLQRLLPQSYLVLALLIGLFLVLGASPVFRPIKYDWISQETLYNFAYQDVRAVYGSGEYGPWYEGDHSINGRYKTHLFDQFTVIKEADVVALPAKGDREKYETTFTIHVKSAPAIVRVPVFWTGAEIVRIRMQGKELGVPVRTFRTRSEVPIRFEVAEPGTYEVVISKPTLWTCLKSFNQVEVWERLRDNSDSLPHH